MSKIHFIKKIILALLIISNSSSGGDNSPDNLTNQCRVETALVRYFLKDGEAPLAVKTIATLGPGIAKKMVIEAINDIIPANKIISLLANLTGTKAVNVYVIHAHRFIHQNKPGEWQIGQQKLSNGGVDYFLPGRDSLENADIALDSLEEKLTNEWSEQLKTQCESNKCQSN